MKAHRSVIGFIIARILACYFVVSASVVIVWVGLSVQHIHSQQDEGVERLRSFIEQVLATEQLSLSNRNDLIYHYLNEKQDWLSSVTLESDTGVLTFSWSDITSSLDTEPVLELSLKNSPETLLIELIRPTSLLTKDLQVSTVLLVMFMHLILFMGLLRALLKRGLSTRVMSFQKELSLIDLEKPVLIQFNKAFTSFKECREVVSNVNRVLAALIRSRCDLEGATEELEQRVASRTASLAEKNRALVKLNQQLSMIANTDSLTQVYNRTRFDQLFNEYVALAHRRKTPLSVLVIDLDDFKKVNDKFGHQVGDQVLKLSAQCISKVVEENGIVARWGGEEFVVLLPYFDIDTAESKAEEIRNKLASARFEDDVQVSASIGVAELALSESSSELLKRADDALYDAKGSGRNRVIIAYFSDTHKQLELETLGEGEFIEVFDAEQAPTPDESEVSGKLLS